MKKFILFFLILLPVIIHSQTSLDFFIKSAVDNNPQVKEYSLSKLISRYERDLINAENVLPRVNLTANYTFVPYFNNNGKYISSDPDPNAIGYDVSLTDGGWYSALVNVEKNLFNGYLINTLEEQVALKEKGSDNSKEILIHDISKQVTDQYLQAYLSQKLLYLENESLYFLKEEQAISSKLMGNGLLKQSEMFLLNIEIDKQQNSCAVAKTDFLKKLNELFSYCGLKGQEEVTLDSLSINMNKIGITNSFYKKYEIDSLSVLNQQALFEAKYRPQLSLFFNTGLNAVSLEGIERKFGMSAGFSFSIPIYDGNQKSITSQQNELSIKSISSYKNYFAVQHKNILANSLSRINNLKTTIENTSKQINNYKKVMEISEKELTQGQLSMVDYLTILKNYIDLKKSFVTSQIDYQTEINNYNYWNW